MLVLCGGVYNHLNEFYHKHEVERSETSPIGDLREPASDTLELLVERVSRLSAKRFWCYD
jgi:hypothetical protein